MKPDVLEVSKKHGSVYAAIVEVWGERCPDYDPDCLCCEAWADYDRGAAMQWRPIETAPKDGTRVLLAYQNVLKKWRMVKAFYAPKLVIEQNDDGDGWCEYDEANDRYCLPEGWYECIENWDDYSYIHMSGVKPTHFMLLPPPPAGETRDEC